MSRTKEGYVLHSYGPERYVRHAVASAVTLRRHDAVRPVALYCPEEHRAYLVRHGIDGLFDLIEELPPAHRSIVGFKHHLHRFMPFERTLFTDADMVWCRNPDALWQRLATMPFTATGLDRADFYFGGPKTVRGVFVDMLLGRRGRTLQRFGLTHLPRVQAGMIFAQDRALAEEVCTLATEFLGRREETHFRSRLHEGRSEESCEWSLAMAMSRLRLPIYPWYQGYESPQLDFVGSLTRYDADFEDVSCRYYCDQFIYGIRGIPNRWVRERTLRFWSTLLRRGDTMEVTPYVLHFGSLHEKQPFFDFADRTWTRLTEAASRTSASMHAHPLSVD